MQLQNSKKQQKRRESEEQGKRKSTESGKGEEGGKMVMEDKENAEGGASVREREKEGGWERGRSEGGSAVVMKSRRSLNFPRSDVRLVKSPTVKITRLPSSLSRKSQGGFAKPMPPNKVANLQTKASKSSRGPLVQQTTNVTNQNQVIEEGVVKSPTKGRSRTTAEIFKDGMRENDADMSQEMGGDSSVAMECSSSVLSPSTPPCTGSSEGLLAGAGSSVSSPALRRSPRLKKRLADAKKGSSSRQDSGSDAKKKRRSNTDKKKEKSLKAVSHYMYFHTQIFPQICQIRTVMQLNTLPLSYRLSVFHASLLILHYHAATRRECCKCAEEEWSFSRAPSLQTLLHQAIQRQQTLPKRKGLTPKLSSLFVHDTIPKPRPSGCIEEYVFTVMVLLSTVGFEAADRSKGCY